MREEITDRFKSKFGRPPDILVKAPGRINIIGEHTDYNDGFVLPAAIDQANYLALAKSGRSSSRFYSIDYSANYEIDKDSVSKTDQGWVNLVSGVVDQVSYRIGQFDLAITGNIPRGAGLSSSAALCCGVGYGLSELFGLGLDKWEIAKIAQQSEHQYGGVECGIMDQFASVFGINNHVLELNCKTLEHKAHEFDVSGYQLVLLDSGVTHALETSAYNTRREESRSAIDKLKEAVPGVLSYQDVTIELLNSNQDILTEVELKRARHVTSENERVREMVDNLKARDFEGAGACLLVGHKSLKNDYEVTCEETDFVVDELMTHDLVLGARQVGGGFGGCVLALAEDSELDDVVSEVTKRYQERFSLSLRTIPIEISDGCQII
ncbi:MAG: galactokinase [Bacteroidota bacterium]